MRFSKRPGGGIAKALAVLGTLLVFRAVRAADAPSRSGDRTGEASEPKTAATTMPIPAVALYSSGVGYFEHAGRIGGAGSTVELQFARATWTTC
jgi:hypothetical protein